MRLLALAARVEREGVAVAFAGKIDHEIHHRAAHARGALRVVGDEIVAVDNLKVDANYYRGPEWSRAEVGRSVELARADGSTVKVTLADYF